MIPFKLHWKGDQLWVHSGCVVAILPDQTKPERAIVYCEAPVDAVTVDETVESAAASWIAALSIDPDDLAADDD